MAYDKELYDWYKAHGICVNCGQERAAPHRIRCEVCLLKNAHTSKKLLTRKSIYKETLERNKQRLRTVRSERKKKGLCVWCGKPIAKTSTCFCIECKAKNQRQNEKKKSGIDRAERPLYGMCYRCGEPIEAGSLCEKCKAQSKANLPTKMCGSLYSYHKNQNNVIFGNSR